MPLSRNFLHRARIVVAALLGPTLAVVVWGSLAPIPPRPIDLGLDYQDLLEHFAVYCLLGSMAASVLRTRPPVIWAALALIALGAALEILQTYTGRDRSLLDALANMTGVLAGTAIARAIVEPLHRRYGSAPS